MFDIDIPNKMDNIIYTDIYEKRNILLEIDILTMFL